MAIAYSASSTAAVAGSSGTFTSITHIGQTATATTSVANNFATNDTVIITGCTPADYNGTWVVTVSSSTVFVYTMAASPASDASDAPIMSYKGTLDIARSTASDNLGLVLFVDPLGGKAANTPTGWTHRVDSPYTGTNGKVVQSYTRVSSSEPTTLNITFSGTTINTIDLIAIQAAYTGVDTASMYDTASGTATAASINITANSVTTALDNEMLVACYLYFNTSAFTPPAGMTYRTQISGPTGSWTMIICDALQAVAGASGNKTATIGTASACEAVMVALKPAAAGGSTGQWFLAC